MAFVGKCADGHTARRLAGCEAMSGPGETPVTEPQSAAMEHVRIVVAPDDMTHLSLGPPRIGRVPERVEFLAGRMETVL